MDEEKKEVKERKGTDFTTLICFTIIIIVTFGALLGSVFRKNTIELEETKENQQAIVENDIVETNTADDYLEETEFDDSTDKDYIMEIINKYDSSKINYYDKTEDYIVAKYLVLEVEDEIECFFIDRESLKVYSVKDGKLKELFNEQLTDSTIGVVNFYLVENKENKETELFCETNAGDGLCYASCELLKVEQKNEVVNLTSIMHYTCDSDEEERKRALLDDDADINEYAAQHTRMYLVENDKVSENDFYEYKKELNDKYKVLLKTYDHCIIFE